MTPPAFRIAAIVDDIVAVLMIVVMLPELLINSRPEIVPLLVRVVIVPLLSMIGALGAPAGSPLESVMPAPTVKLPRVHPGSCTKLTLVFEFTAYGLGDRHSASADKWLNPKIARLRQKSH